MNRPPVYHLSPDAVDLWLDGGALPPAEERHLGACPVCRELLTTERFVVDQLAALGSLTPAPGFEERVMAAVHLPDPFALRRLAAARSRITASPRSLALAVVVALALVGSMGASIAWSLANPEFLARAGEWAMSRGGDLLWSAVRGGASALLAQPWFDVARGAVGTPLRLALASGMAALLYVSALLLLRRLLALPAPRVADAGA